MVNLTWSPRSGPSGNPPATLSVSIEDWAPPDKDRRHDDQTYYSDHSQTIRHPCAASCGGSSAPSHPRSFSFCTFFSRHTVPISGRSAAPSLCWNSISLPNLTSGQTISADRGQKPVDFGPTLRLYSNQGPANLTANPRVFPLDPTECISFTIIVNQGTDQHSHEIKLNGNEAIEIYNSTSADKAEAKGCVFSMSRDGAEMDVHVATTDGIEGKQLLVLRIERNNTGCCVLSTIRRTNSHPTYKPSVKGASCEYEWKEIAQEAWEAGTWREDMSHDQELQTTHLRSRKIAAYSTAFP